MIHSNLVKACDYTCFSTPVKITNPKQATIVMLKFLTNTLKNAIILDNLKTPMHKYTTKLISLFLISTTLLTACNIKGEIKNEEEKILRGKTEKEVEIFEIGKNKPELYIEKTASSNAKSTVKVSPQINGQVIEIKVKLGEFVEKGATLITLGDSLNTDIIDLQYKTSEQSKRLSESNKTTTKYLGQQNIDAAQLGVVASRQSYENALKAKEDAISIFQTQYDNSLIEIENAKLSLESAQENLEAAEDNLDDTEYDLDDISDQIRTAPPEQLPTLEATERQLENAVDSMESQVRNAELAVDLAQNRITQSEIALAKLSETYRSQFTQLNAGIESAVNQYHNAVNQLETIQASVQLQEIGAETQIIQSQSALDSARINKEQKNIKAPISGKITAINIEEGNQVSPGQILVQIENDQVLTLSTSVNSNEAKFIRFEDKAIISHNNEVFEGVITSINPTLNEISKKIDIEIEMIKTLNLPIGEFVKVALPVRPQKTFFIPLNSIFLEDGIKNVRIVEDSKVKYQKISTGEIIEEYVEIIKGLKPGDKVITSVEKFLKEGEKVTTKNAK